MPLTSITRLQAEKRINWNWPLSFAYLSESFSKDTISKIDANCYWSKRLSYNYLLNLGRLRCNILICQGSLEQMIEDFRNFDLDINVDLVVLQVKSFEELANIDVDKIVKFLQFRTNTSGVLFKENTDETHYFIEGLIFNLSHNNSIEDVFVQILEKGLFYRTEALVKASRLEHFHEKFWKEIAELPARRKEAIIKKAKETGTLGKILERSHDVNVNTDSKPNEIITQIIKAAKKFEYLHESDESSQTAETSREVLSHEKVIISSGVNSPEMESIIKRVEPRFLQCRIQDEEGKTIMTYLSIHKVYELNIRIGPGDKDWLNAAGIGPSSISFSDDVKEEIKIVVRIKDQTYIGNFYISKYGPSGEARFNFSFEEVGAKVIEIYAYHQSRIIQMSALGVDVVDSSQTNENVPYLNMEQMVSPRIILDNLEDRMKFGTSFISTPKGTSGLLFSDSETAIETLPLASGMQDVIDEIRRIIEKAVIKIIDHPEDIFHKNNVEILRILAIKGSGLYQNYLKGKGDFDKPTQIISRKSDYVPFEFVFTDPTPKLTSELCPNAKTALEKGSCENCEHRNKTDKKYFCPFGFLALRTIIERHEYGAKKALLNGDDIGIYAEPTTGRREIPIVENVAFASAKRVESKTPKLIKSVSDSIATVAEKYESIDNWEEWKTNIDKMKPKTLILISHTEQREDSYFEELEIGDEDFVIKEAIDNTFVTKDQERNPPALILIGCGTQDNNRRFIDFTSQFKNHGASIVLSTFTKIRGRQAGPIVKQLMQFFNDRKGEKVRFGEIVLRLRQHMMSRGMLVSLALIAHGDADWIIEI